MLLGLLGLVLFEFMILRSVGIAGAIVVGLAVAGGADAAARAASRCSGRASIGWPIRRVSARPPRPTGHGLGSPGGSWAGRSRSSSPRSASCSLLGLAVPARPLQRSRRERSCRPTCRRGPAYDLLRDEFGEGEFAPLALADPDRRGRPRRRQNVGRPPRLLAAGSPPTRGSPASTASSTSTRALTLDQYQLLYGDPNGPRDRFVATVLGGHDQGRPDRVHDHDAATARTATRVASLVHDLRDPDRPARATGRASTVLVGGGAAEVADVVDRVAADFPRTALFIIVTTYLVLFVLLRSVVLPAKALVMNALSITASFGALVWIFQDGNLSGPLGFQPLGFVETTQPVILFCVLFGLSMDYEVFLLSRMKEVWDRTGDNTEAVARGLERSGRIVTSAALIVVVVAGSFAFADIVLIKALGLGVAIAVALDATVVRALLVPATMRLLGRWNWWMPASLERFVGDRLPASEADDRSGRDGPDEAPPGRPPRVAVARRSAVLAAARSSPTRRRRARSVARADTAARAGRRPACPSSCRATTARTTA